MTKEQTERAIEELTHLVEELAEAAVSAIGRRTVNELKEKASKIRLEMGL